MHRPNPIKKQSYRKSSFKSIKSSFDPFASDGGSFHEIQLEDEPFFDEENANACNESIFRTS